MERTYTITRGDETMYEFLIRTGKFLKHFLKPGEVKDIKTIMIDGTTVVKEFKVTYERDRNA